jgi:hypothetical protein
MIEHLGPAATIGQAYRNLADGIRRSQYEFREDPPVQVFFDPASEDEARRAQVWFPVRWSSRKKDQEGRRGRD